MDTISNGEYLKRYGMYKFSRPLQWKVYHNYLRNVYILFRNFAGYYVHDKQMSESLRKNRIKTGEKVNGKSADEKEGVIPRKDDEKDYASSSSSRM